MTRTIPYPTVNAHQLIYLVVKHKLRPDTYLSGHPGHHKSDVTAQDTQMTRKVGVVSMGDLSTPPSDLSGDKNHNTSGQPPDVICAQRKNSGNGNTTTHNDKPLVVCSEGDDVTRNSGASTDDVTNTNFDQARSIVSGSCAGNEGKEAAYRRLYRECWSQEPGDRPSATQVLQKLRGMM